MTSEQPQQTRPAVLTIDLDALASNLRVYETLTRTQCSAVLKADGYGLGADAAAATLARAGVRIFWTATAEEGVLLRASLGPEPVIYVLHGATGDAVPLLQAAALRPVISTPEQLQAWSSAGGGPFALHVDTGMNRLGIPCDQLGAIQDALMPEPPALLMSHLACAGAPRHPMNERQSQAFKQARAWFPDVPASLAATAGAALGTGFALDITRLGIGLHGDNAMDDPDDGPLLRQVATLTAPIVQLRHVSPGQSVGYGATYAPDRPIIVATIALGYADGYMRAASNRGFGVLDGSRCPIVGRVSMDLITLDVTDAPGASVGAAVQMLGTEAPLREVANAAGTIAYEVATSLGRIARRYVGGAA